MAQHAAPARGMSLSPTSAGVVIPVITGVLYGFWAANIQRFGHGVTGGNVALGFVTGIIVAALCLGIHQWSKQQAGRHIGLRAATWAAFAGIAVGFLHSLANSAIIWSIVLGLIVAASTFVATYYRYYTATEPV
ncbi:hypothetical protein [Streptomyces sp. VRA16 Mangrove soil]|uniref:hypothetical protein n=1 Tax=Streptomyces sp. VRA16 Mangrove soil TaxID=2817434 RepID=UPI001A9ECA63|nr:hypothetical protein [Streptomyces sp. VRA16 Mangrove soil]MBO1333582.1 hypothetical protein [Streptomyces sp. VRA16 Mangrove soil]